MALSTISSHLLRPSIIRKAKVLLGGNPADVSSNSLRKSRTVWWQSAMEKLRRLRIGAETEAKSGPSKENPTMPPVM